MKCECNEKMFEEYGEDHCLLCKAAPAMLAALNRLLYVFAGFAFEGDEEIDEALVIARADALYQAREVMAKLNRNSFGIA